MGSKAKMPTPSPEADYAQYLAEGQNALNAQGALLPQMAGIELRTAPALQQAQFAGLKGQAQGMLGLYNNLYAPAQAMQQRYATDQLGLMAGMGSQATAAAIGSLDSTTRGIYSTFGQQALEGLQAGTSLTQQEQTYAQQAARAAAQSRGVNFSRQGSDLEVLNTYQLGQQRLAQRQTTAQQAFGLGQAQQQFGYQGFLSPTYAASQQYGLTGLTASAQQGYGNLGNTFLTPESQYLANIRANRIQSETSIAAANAAQSGAIWGGVLGAAGSIAGGYLKRA